VSRRRKRTEEKKEEVKQEQEAKTEQGEKITLPRGRKLMYQQIADDRGTLYLLVQGEAGTSIIGTAHLHGIEFTNLLFRALRAAGLDIEEVS